MEELYENIMYYIQRLWGSEPNLEVLTQGQLYLNYPEIAKKQEARFLYDNGCIHCMDMKCKCSLCNCNGKGQGLCHIERK